jgi:hypothetical protein
MLPDQYDLDTNCEILGGSRLGKSKLVQHCCREHIIEGNPYCVFDYHGTLYEACLNDLACLQPDRPVILLDFVERRFIRTYNPFALPPGAELTAHVKRSVDRIARAWGLEDTDELPTFSRIAKMVLTLAAGTGEPLHLVARLLELPKKELRESFIPLIENSFIRQQWVEFQYLTQFRDWKHEVQSTQNRLGRFLDSTAFQLFAGLKGPTERVSDWIDRKAIVLVNLKPHPGKLDPETAKTFASFLLTDFLDAAMQNTSDPKPYFLYLDECQNYLTPDAGPMLDQVLKSGLRLTFIHHHRGQFHDSPALQDSLDMNAGINFIFGGLKPEQAKPYAEKLFLGELNERWKKEDRFQYVTDYTEDWTESVTESEGELPSGSTHSKSVTSASRLVPSHRKERTGQDDWAHEEKLSQLGARLAGLRKRECYLYTPEGTEFYEVPWVEDFLLNPERVLEYERTLQADAIPLHEAQERLRTEEREFLDRAKEYERAPGRPKKKPATLHPQR